MIYIFDISTFVQKTEILKYQIAERNAPLDYMRAAMAAIRSGLPSSIHSNLITFFSSEYIKQEK